MSTAEAVLKPYEQLLRSDLKAIASRLEIYAGLLIKWNASQNLVSRETLAGLWTRHIADSLQLLPLIGDKEGTFVDLGSGGGLPALPIAIASEGYNRHFELFEPTTKKASFLRTVARETSTPVTVRAERVTADHAQPPANVITSRALASLTDLLPLLQQFAAPHTCAFLHKGRDYRRELAEAAQHHQFDVLVHPSSVDPEGVVLELTRFGR